MGTKKSHTYITETATATTPSWTNSQIAAFHYFNPNGLLAKWEAMCRTLRDYVNLDVIPSGWHLAYGSFSDFSANKIRELGMAPRVGGIELQVAIESIQRDIATGYNKLAEVLAA